MWTGELSLRPFRLSRIPSHGMFESASYQAFSDTLNELHPGWTVSGNQVVGPNREAVRLTQQHHSSSVGHYDVEFILDTTSPRPVAIWDCVGGFGTTEAERATQWWVANPPLPVLQTLWSAR